ncbi:MAG: TIGR03915 family putative DNA repair protein [Clostridia bacterium]
MNLIYDSSYQGLLTSLYIAHKQGNVSRIVTKKYQVDIFNQDVVVKTNERIAQKMNTYLGKKYGQEFIKDIYYTNLSNSLERATLILNFYNLASKSNYDISSIFSHPDALPVKKLSYKVGFEKHRFLGLLRFSDYQDVLVAKYQPDNNITELLMTHFADRMSNFKFIIIDEARGIAGVYNKKKWFIDNDFNSSFLPDEIQDDFEILWKNYFNVTTIKSRINHKLQRQYLPKRYLKYLPEFKR